MHTRRAVLAAFSLLLFIAESARSESKDEFPSPASIPVEVFFKDQDFSTAKVSPDGSRIAFAAPVGTGHVGIAVMDLGTGKVEPIFGANDLDVSFLHWKDDDLLVFGASVVNAWDPMRSISLKTRKVVSLSERIDFFSRTYVQKAPVLLADILPSHPSKILVHGLASRLSYRTQFMLMDPWTGERTLLGEAADGTDVEQVLVATDGTVRARVRLSGGRRVVEVRPSADAGFLKAADLAWSDPRWSLLWISNDSKTVYVVVETETSRNSLHALDTETGDLGTPVVEVADGLISNIEASTQFGKVYGVMVDGDLPSRRTFDASRAELLAQIDASLPRTFNTVVSSSRDEQVLVIFSYSDIEPGSYYILDRRVPRLMLLGKTRSKIEPSLMQPTKSVRFAARDGVEIQAYLTQPKGREGRPNPLIILLQEDVFSTREYWGFDSEVQFFASRGYSVMKVNFRGSTGFGNAFWRAGWKQLAGKIQEDLADAANWAVENRVAEARRIAVCGSLFGGTLALNAIAHPGSPFRCAINYSGALDLTLNADFVERQFDSDFNDSFTARFGESIDELRVQSPINLVENFSAPSLHIYFYSSKLIRDDSQVRLRGKLKKAGKPFEEWIVKDEKVFVDYPKTLSKAYTRILEFLAKHMPADE